MEESKCREKSGSWPGNKRKYGTPLTVRCYILQVTQKIRFRNGKDQAWYFNPLLMKKKEKETPKLLQFIGIKKIKLNWFSIIGQITCIQSIQLNKKKLNKKHTRIRPGTLARPRNCHMAVSRTTIKPILGYLEISIF